MTATEAHRLALMDATGAGRAGPSAARPRRPSWSRRRSPGSRRSTRSSTRSSTSSSRRAGPPRPTRSARRARSRASRSCSRTSAPPTPASRFTSACRRSRRPTSAPRSTPISAERFRAAGLRRRRQDEHPRARDPADDRARRLRRDPQPVEHRRTPGGSSGRRRRRRSRRAWSRSPTPTTAAARSGSPPAINGLVGLKPTRQRITEGPLVGDNMCGPHGRARAHPLGSRHRGRSSTRSTGPPRAIPYVAPAACAARTSRSSTPSRGRFGSALSRAAGGPGTRVAAGCVDRGRARRRGPARVELGHEVEESTLAERRRRREALNLEDTFMTRWAAGPGGDARHPRARARPPAHRRRRRAADLGAGRGRDASRSPAEYLPTRSPFTSSSRESSPAGSRAASTCC